MTFEAKLSIANVDILSQNESVKSQNTPRAEIFMKFLRKRGIQVKLEGSEPRRLLYRTVGKFCWTIIFIYALLTCSTFSFKIIGECLPLRMFNLIQQKVSEAFIT